VWSVNRIKRCCYIQYVTTFAIPDLQSGIDKWRVLSRARHLWFKLQCCDKCLAGACRKIAQWRHFQHSKISKLKINTPYVYGNKCNFIILNWWWAFFGVVPFLRYWPRSSPKLTKNQFLEKNDPLTETFQNFATKGFTGTWIQVFLPCFAEIGKAEVNKRVRGIHHEKRLIFCPFLCGFWSDIAKLFTESRFPIRYLDAKFCPNPSSFRRDISENVFQTHYNIGVKPADFSPTIAYILGGGKN